MSEEELNNNDLDDSESPSPASTDKSTTHVSRFKNWIMNHPIFSVIIIVGIIAIAVGEFTGAIADITKGIKTLLKLTKSPTAHLTVLKHDNGISTIRFKFTDVPKNFSIEKISLRLEQVKPVGPIDIHPSDTIKPAYYNLKITDDLLSKNNPTIERFIDFYHNPKEPYALCELCLWYARQNSRISIKVYPTFFDEKGSIMNIPTIPEAVEVNLENREIFNSIPIQTGKNVGKTDPCSDRNKERK